MKPGKAESHRFPAVFLALILILSFGSAGHRHAGQGGVPPGTQPPAGEGARATPDTASEQKISPQEAERLFRSVDEILRFASQDTLFPIKHEVKRQLVSREEVEAYVVKHTTEDEDAKRLRRSELVLKKFGPVSYTHLTLPTNREV